MRLLLHPANTLQAFGANWAHLRCFRLAWVANGIPGRCKAKCLMRTTAPLTAQAPLHSSGAPLIGVLR